MVKKLLDKMENSIWIWFVIGVVIGLVPGWIGTPLFFLLLLYIIFRPIMELVDENDKEIL